MKPAIRIRDLHVNRSNTFALHIRQLSVKPGTVLCVTGANGSGKTTLIECVTGLMGPTSGEITIAGYTVTNNLRVTKAVIGFVPDDEDWLIKELSAAEYFKLLGGIYKDAGIHTDMHRRVNYLARLLNFSAADQPLGTLSHGNKKKVQLIAGLMHEPKVIILDELRNGLDPLAIIAAEDLIKSEAGRGACILAATHDLWWAERVANDIVLLGNGSVKVHAKTASIIQRYGSIEKLFLHMTRSKE